MFQSCCFGLILVLRLPSFSVSFWSCLCTIKFATSKIPSQLMPNKNSLNLRLQATNIFLTSNIFACLSSWKGYSRIFKWTTKDFLEKHLPQANLKWITFRYQIKSVLQETDKINSNINKFENSAISKKSHNSLRNNNNHHYYYYFCRDGEKTIK